MNLLLPTQHMAKYDIEYLVIEEDIYSILISEMKNRVWNRMNKIILFCKNFCTHMQYMSVLTLEKKLENVAKF